MLADLIDIATAVYVAGWLSPRRGNEVLDIEVQLPLRNANFFSQSNILYDLENLLQWYTMDRWHFKFKQRQKGARRSENPSTQMQMQFAANTCDEIALWSGGLDSLAGLYSRIVNKAAKQYTLLGTGSNLQVQGKQSQIAQAIQRKYPDTIKLIQIPIQLVYPDPEMRPKTSDAFRSRGFTFKLLGSVCAYLEGQNVLSIYENGYGALNLPFKLSEIAMSHTRSVHPQSLINMGEFVSKVLGETFRCHNPYLFATKAEMCKALSMCKDLAFETQSCDGRHRKTDQSGQCGYCSSCLLRRMSLLNAFGFDKTPYVDSELSGRRARYFTAMQLQVTKINQILESQDPWQGLIHRYVQLRQLSSHLSKAMNVTEIEVQSQLLQLYQKHVDEWMNVSSLLKQTSVHEIPPTASREREGS